MNEVGEQEPILVPLEAKREQNPEAFNFDDIPDTKAVKREPIGLNVMLGGYSEEIETAVGVFLVRPPKLREQRELIRVKRELDSIPVDALDAEERYLDALIGLARCVLYVQGQGSSRPATSEEIESAFDAQEVQAIIGRATGWKPQEGEQGDPPVL